MNLIQTSFQRTCWAIVGLVIASVATASAAQDPPLNTDVDSTQLTQPDSQQTQEQPAGSKSFLEIISEIRNNEREINRLFSSMPIGFPDEQKLQMNQIERLRADNLKLQAQMDEAALAAYQANPGGDRRAARIVFNLLSDKIDVSSRDGVFDPQGALEIADLMLKANSATDQPPTAESIPPANIAYQAFRASFAIQDFERADAMLKQIESAGVPLLPSIRQQLEQTREKWNRELLIRRLESSTDDLPRVKLETSEGDIVVELFENHAPQTVANFISLVEKHLYDELTFFHVQPGEFAQTGCPLENGTGDPGYQIPCECEREQIRHHFAGTLSMVINGKDTGGSQFRIMHQPSGQLDGKSTAFGRVIEGLEIVYRLKKVDHTKQNFDDVQPSKMIKATVIRKRDHDYRFSRLAKKPDESNGISDLPSSLTPIKGSTPGG